MTTLLERAKGSPLDVVIDHGAPSNRITPLLPHTRQIRHLAFSQSYWTEVSSHSRVISGPLPLLRTLTIRINESDGLYGQPNKLDALLFSGAINLEGFVFEPGSTGSLNNFVFPNLSTLKLSTPPLTDFKASDLFDFLNASPKLRTVEVKIRGDTHPETAPRELVVLPNVETFSLNVYGTRSQVYESAIHISCPRATYTSLEQDIFNKLLAYGTEVFPNFNSCQAIFHQYSTSPVEEVTLEVKDSGRIMTLMEYSLTFKSSNAAVIRLGFNLGKSEEELDFSHEDLDLLVFTRACQVIQFHPQLSHIRRLHIKDCSESFSYEAAMAMAGVLQEFLGSLGPLDELAIHGFDPHILLPESGYSVFPPVKELTIAELAMFDEELYADAIVELAKSQHELKKPFERVKIHAREIPATMEERLGPWVSEADCRQL